MHKKRKADVDDLTICASETSPDNGRNSHLLDSIVLIACGEAMTKAHSQDNASVLSYGGHNMGLCNQRRSTSNVEHKLPRPIELLVISHFESFYDANRTM